MSAKTTADMVTAIETASSKVKAAMDELHAAITSETIEDFESALRVLGARPQDAGEFAAGLRSWLRHMDENADDLSAAAGSASHVVHAAVHRTHRLRGGNGAVVL